MENQSENVRKIYWTKAFSEKAIFSSILIIISLNFAFYSYRMPMELAIIGILIICFFFVGLSYYTKNWEFLSLNVYYRKLFVHSFIYRLIFVGILYLLTLMYDPANFPFEISAADSWVYHIVGINLKGNFLNGKFTEILSNPKTGLHYSDSTADWGYSFYTGIIYTIFGINTFLVRLLNCFWGSLTVLMLSKISNMLFSEKHAKLTGILAMLMPPLLYFTGIQLKETLMIFLVVTIFYSATKIVEYRKFRLIDVSIVISFIFLLFYFRTFLALFIFLSLVLYFFFNLSKKSHDKYVIFFSILISSIGVIYLIKQYGFIKQIEYMYTAKTSQGIDFLNNQIKMVGNIDVESTVMFPFIILSSFITPFPAFLNIDIRQIGILVQFPNEVIRNFLYYFAYIGIIYSLRNNLRQNLLMLMFILVYVITLAVSSTSYFGRYQLVALPFLIIYISNGYLKSSKLLKKRWDIYLTAVLILQLMWNLFKLRIRGAL